MARLTREFCVNSAVASSSGTFRFDLLSGGVLVAAASPSGPAARAPDSVWLRGCDLAATLLIRRPGGIVVASGLIRQALGMTKPSHADLERVPAGSLVSSDTVRRHYVQGAARKVSHNATSGDGSFNFSN